MAALIHINIDGKKHYRSLGTDAESARKKFAVMCNGLISVMEKDTTVSNLQYWYESPDEFHIKYLDGFEWIDDIYIFDEDNNDTYR